MASYAAHTLVAFGGRLGAAVGSSQEIWQCGIRLRIQLPDLVSWGAGLTSPAAYQASIAAPLATWFHRSAVTTAGSEFLGLRSDAWLDWLKVNNIAGGPVGPGQPGGKYADPTHTNRYDYPTPTNGGSANTSLPTFVTLAVSLLTANARGPGHRGRIYLPIYFAPGAQTIVTGTTPVQANGTVAALLDVLRAPTDSAGTIVPIVASSVNGATLPITKLACGQVMDVQRRRKNKLPEAPYITRNYP